MNSKDLGLGPEFTKSTHGEFCQSSAQLNKAYWVTWILSVLPQGIKQKKVTHFCSSGWTCCPRSHSSLSRRGKHTGTSKGIPEGGHKRTCPGAIQVKSISYSHTFNKTDLYSHHANDYILWNSQLQQMPQNSSSPNTWPQFQMFYRCLWFVAQLSSSYPHSTVFTQQFWHVVIHFLGAGVAFQK